MRRTLALILITIFCLSLPAATMASVSATANPPQLEASGTVTFTVTVYNDGTSDWESFSISGHSLSFDTDGIAIAPGESHSFSKIAVIPDSLIGQTLSFTVNYYEAGVQQSAVATVTVLNSSGGITDPSNPNGGVITPVVVTAALAVSTTQASPGDIVTLTYTVNNGGIYPVTALSITDTDIGGRAAMVSGITVEPGIPYVFEYQYKMGNSTVTSAAVIDYLNADGTANKVTLPEKTLGMVNSKISVTVQQGTSTADGQQFTLTLVNDGNQRVSKIKITDELGNTVKDNFQLAIGESTTASYTVPTDEARNVVFHITGTDALNENYTDKTSTYPVRKYIDPALIGIKFSATVTETLNAAGSITVEFVVENTGSLEMHNLVLTEEESGELHRLASFPQGTQRIIQKINVVEPRALVFTLTVSDPSGNVYEYRANITADYVGMATTGATPPPTADVQGDLITDVGGSISTGLRTALIVLAVLTVIAGILLILLTALEREEHKRMAKRKAQRERKRRQQEQLAREDAATRHAPTGTTQMPPARGQNGERPPRPHDDTSNHDTKRFDPQ